MCLFEGGVLCVCLKEVYCVFDYRRSTLCLFEVSKSEVCKVCL